MIRAGLLNRRCIAFMKSTEGVDEYGSPITSETTKSLRCKVVSIGGIKEMSKNELFFDNVKKFIIRKIDNAESIREIEWSGCRYIIDAMNFDEDLHCYELTGSKKNE